MAFVTTEHFTLQGARSQTISDLGLVTFDRALQSGIEDHGYARRIARLRDFYLNYAPELVPSLLSVPPSERLRIQGLRAGSRRTAAVLAQGPGNWVVAQPGAAGSCRGRGRGRKGGEAVTGLSADLVLRVGAAYSLAGEVYRAVAVRGAEVVAVSADPHGLDDLAGSTTRVVGDPALTVLPAFADAHEHLLEAAKNRGLVPVDQARSVAEFAAAVGRAAAAAAEGQWVQTSVAWHESNLAEGRLPTRTELDAASPDRPVVARRGGHLAVANSAALGLAGITAATPDPPGGSIGHTDDGELSGVVEGAAVYQVLAFAPPPTLQVLVAGLREASAA